MINDRINDLYKAIEESPEYQEYIKIGKILEEDQRITTLIEEIKVLQQKSVNLEYNNNPEYKKVDKEIKEKVNKLNNIPIYQEYLKRMNTFNDILSESSYNIEQYINSKI
ncbi:MAG: YlbF family regulator [Bacilli bacterium]|nr:YlbF family regulator [Bacilli bacterium]